MHFLHISFCIMFKAERNEVCTAGLHVPLSAQHEAEKRKRENVIISRKRKLQFKKRCLDSFLGRMHFELFKHRQALINLYEREIKLFSHFI